MKYRKAMLNDIPALCQIRKKQLLDEGIAPNNTIDEELNAYFLTRISDETLVEWLAEEEDEIIATAAIAFISFPPTYTNKSGVKGYITNMYTDPSHRGKGIAEKMLKYLMNEAIIRDVHKLWLRASEMGRPVYEKTGFKKVDQYMEMNI